MHVLSMINEKNIVLDDLLIIAPHPDDEILGCGGLIQYALKKNVRVDLIILTNGEASHSGCCEKKDISLNRKKLTYKAAQTIGLPQENIHKLSFKDGQVSVDDVQNYVQLYKLLNNIKPRQIFIPHQNEGWNDHVVVKSLIDSFIRENKQIAVYEYLVWSWYYVRGFYDWKRCRVLNMNRDVHDVKKKAMDDYIKEIAPCGKPWSGTLPEVLIKACSWNKELYFKVK